MNDSGEDEYRRYCEQLRDAVVQAAPGWLDRVLRPFVADSELADRAQMQQAIDASLAAIDARLTTLVATDIDTPMSGPLELLRQSTGPVQEWLNAAGAPRPVRDPWDVRSSPDDHYALGPMAFSDLGDDVHAAGIAWGAAKAHVHLRRRSQSSGGGSA